MQSGGAIKIIGAALGAVVLTSGAPIPSTSTTTDTVDISSKAFGLPGVNVSAGGTAVEANPLSGVSVNAKAPAWSQRWCWD